MLLNLDIIKGDGLFSKISTLLKDEGFKVVSEDKERPWGGFFVIDENQAEAFARRFFPETPLNTLKLTEKLSPKFLIVAPDKRLSWQYHLRRAEIWKVLSGKVGVVRSETDEEGDLVTLKEGELVKLHQGERHRLVGLKDWAVLAEIWQHTDPSHPSDEQDIIRIQDDFGR